MMEVQNDAARVEAQNTIIYGPLSFLTSIAALISIVSIYGPILAASLGIWFGYLAIRNNQKVLGLFGIALNILALLATALMMVFIYFFTQE